MKDYCIVDTNYIINVRNKFKQNLNLQVDAYEHIIKMIRKSFGFDIYSSFDYHVQKAINNANMNHTYQRAKTAKIGHNYIAAQQFYCYVYSHI